MTITVFDIDREVARYRARPSWELVAKIRALAAVFPKPLSPENHVRVVAMQKVLDERRKK